MQVELENGAVQQQPCIQPYTVTGPELTPHLIVQIGAVGRSPLYVWVEEFEPLEDPLLPRTTNFNISFNQNIPN